MSIELKYQEWRETFGQWLKRSGRISECAAALGISKQSCSRYFVHRTIQPPADTFWKALVWQEKTRTIQGEQWGYRSFSIDEKFQTWNVLQPVPKVEPTPAVVPKKETRRRARPNS